MHPLCCYVISFSCALLGMQYSWMLLPGKYGLSLIRYSSTLLSGEVFVNVISWYIIHEPADTLFMSIAGWYIIHEHCRLIHYSWAFLVCNVSVPANAHTLLCVCIRILACMFIVAHTSSQTHAHVFTSARTHLHKEKQRQGKRETQELNVHITRTHVQEGQCRRNAKYAAKYSCFSDGITAVRYVVWRHQTPAHLDAILYYNWTPFCVHFLCTALLLHVVSGVPYCSCLLTADVVTHTLFAPRYIQLTIIIYVVSSHLCWQSRWLALLWWNYSLVLVFFVCTPYFFFYFM